MSDGFANGVYQGGVPSPDEVAQGIVWSFVSHKNYDRLKDEIAEELTTLLDAIKHLEKRINALTPVGS